MSGRPPELHALHSIAGSHAEPPVSSGARAAAWTDKLPAGIFTLLRNAHGLWTFPELTNKAEHLLGVPAAALRQDAHALEQVLHPDDVAGLKQRVAHSRESGLPWKARFRIERAGMNTRWLEALATPEVFARGGTQWTGLLLDVTYDHQLQQQSRSRQQLRGHAARAAELGLIELDSQSGQVSLDPLASQHHGLDPSHREMTMQRWLDMLVPEDRDTARNALTVKPTGLAIENRVVHLPIGPASRGERTLELTSMTLPDPSRHVCVCRDVTAAQAREAAQRLTIANDMAQRSRTEFLSRVSHELRTPLNGVLGYAQLMALDTDHPLPKPQADRLQVLQESSAKLLAIIDQLITVSGLDRGQISLRPEVVDLAPLVGRCVAQAEPLAQVRGIDLSAELGDAPPRLRADPLALEQVLNQLLSNAIKFNRLNGRVRMRFVQTSNVPGGSGVGTLIIDDTGVGLSSVQLRRLFEPFNRLGAERSPISGAGLGLVTAQKLVQAMGGKLKAWSQLGIGSRFAVSLSLARPDRVDGALESDFSPFAASPSSQWDTGMQRVVLYIEDDEVNTMLMEQVFLMQPEWRLVTAASGEEGIELALTQNPELALVDIGLPGISGIETVQRLAQDVRTRHVRCVALSADTLPEQARAALAAGFEDYWTKPFDILTMLDKLKAVLR